MKIKIQKKFYIWLKSEIEEKNQYSKKTKKNNKKIRIEIDVKK